MRVFLGLALSAAMFAQSGGNQLNVDSFEHVWKTIRDKHWDPKLGGLDWQAVHDQLRPKVEEAKNIGEARRLMLDMLGRLKQTHFNIFPGDVYSEVGQAPRGDGSPGIEIRIVDNRPVVTEVQPGSPAEKVGIRPGWVVTKIGPTVMQPVIERIAASQKGTTLSGLYQSRAVTARLSGAAGTKVPVEFLDGSNQPIVLELERAEPRGHLARFGYLPPTYVWFASRRVANTGYIRFNMFLDLPRLAPAFEDAVKSCMKCDGIIIDLRGNPGGIGGMAMGMAGLFIDKKNLHLGTMYLRDTNMRFIVNPRVETFSGPVAILVDEATGSTSEIFAGGMKDLGRARIFGSRTAGAALPSVIERLPNGDGFQYATANYISEGGKPLEGLGVMPDVDVKLTREALLAGRDPALDAAVDWIKTQRKQP